jgi:hypothetical protein
MIVTKVDESQHYLPTEVYQEIPSIANIVVQVVHNSRSQADIVMLEYQTWVYEMLLSSSETDCYAIW